MHRSAYVVAGLLFAAPARAAAPAEDPPTATMQCERAAEPGRVRCSVEAHAPAGGSIVWGDVAIVALPELASALRGRLGPDEATTRTAEVYKWAFGVVAKKTGQGEAKAKVRLVVCDSEARCAPRTVDVSAVVAVGN